MTTQSNNIFADLFASMNDSYTKLYQMEAIWMERIKVVRNDEIVETNRIAAGDKIDTAMGFIVTCNGNPTHEIVKVMGTLANNRFEIEAKNLATGETEAIKLLP